MHNDQLLVAKLPELCCSNVNNVVIHHTKAMTFAPFALPHMYISIDALGNQTFVQLCSRDRTPALQVIRVVTCTLCLLLSPCSGSECNSRDPTVKQFVHAASIPQVARSVKPYFESRTYGSSPHNCTSENMTPSWQGTRTSGYSWTMLKPASENETHSGLGS